MTVLGLAIGCVSAATVVAPTVSIDAYALMEGDVPNPQ